MPAPEVRRFTANIRQLCKQFRVARPELFGSAATEHFDPSRTDVDFLVEFEGADNLFVRYFDFKESLESLLGRSVDLVTRRALNNPHFRQQVENQRVVIYESQSHQAGSSGCGWAHSPVTLLFATSALRNVGVLGVKALSQRIRSQ